MWHADTTLTGDYTRGILRYPDPDRIAGAGAVSGRAQLDCPWSRLHVYQWLDVDTDTVRKAEAAQEGRVRAGPHTRTRVCTGLALATEARDMKHPDNLGRYCTRPTLDTTYHTDTRHSLHLPLHHIK